jgi:hypothetical protein
MKEIPVAKIKMMKASIRCLGLGFLGLLPLIGPPFAFAALWYSFRARRLEKERGLWNPAKTQRIAGLVCASIGALVWTGVDSMLIYNACYSYINS